MRGPRTIADYYAEMRRTDDAYHVAAGLIDDEPECDPVDGPSSRAGQWWIAGLLIAGGIAAACYACS